MQQEFDAEQTLILNALTDANSGIAIIDRQGIIKYANKKFGEIYGQNPIDLKGNNYADIFLEEEKAATLSNLNQLFLTNKKVSGERRFNRKAGIIDIHFTAEIIGSTEKFLLVTVNDITSFKGIEERLAQNELEFRSHLESSAAKNEEVRKLIMNAALDAIICINKDDTVTLWNPQAEKIFGWQKDEVIGKRLAEIIVPELYRERHVAGMKRYLETGTGPALNVLLELTAINRDGHEFPIELTVLPIRQDDADEIFCAFIRDITERKKNEAELKALNMQMAVNIEELAKSNVELEQFAYVASHDLQEPLRMVTNFLTQLEKKYEGKLDDTGKQYLNFAVDGAVRMRKIILDLLEYSKAGKTDVNTEAVDINDIIAEILRINSALIEEKNAVIKSSDMPVVSANRTALKQIFQNLIGNALKYQSDNKSPVIEVGSEDLGDHWQFSVSDNGIGIDERFFEKIFVIFQRLHSKEEYSGTGIGLAICKKIIESHGGTIWVVSKPGRGSTFYFTIKK